MIRHMSLSEMAAPSIGAIFGTGCSRAIAERLSSKYEDGVVFGKNRRPISERFRHFREAIMAPMAETKRLLRKTSSFVIHRDGVVQIDDEFGLEEVPNTMQFNILTHPEIRNRLIAGKIHGWGYKNDQLPLEDVAGRLISNGWWNSDDEEDVVTFEWDSEDPQFDEDELEAIALSRDFVLKKIHEEETRGKEGRDPTNRLLPFPDK